MWCEPPGSISKTETAETGFLRSKKRARPYEVEKCLGIIAEVLTDVKAKREAAESVRKWWVRNASPVSDHVPRSTSIPLPVLVLDELHQQQLPDASDEGLYWAIFITGAQLARGLHHPTGRGPRHSM